MKCPKCKSWKRIPFPAHIIHEKEYIKRHGLFFKARATYVIWTTTFYCLSCGYELGRYG